MKKSILKAVCGVALLLTPSAHADFWGGNDGGPVTNPNQTPPPPVKYNHQGVFMVHYDQQRTGVQPNESTLTPQNVGPGSFGKLHTFPTDGYTMAQPLYVSSVNINYKNNPMDVIYVATENLCHFG